MAIVDIGSNRCAWCRTSRIARADSNIQRKGLVRSRQRRGDDRALAEDGIAKALAALQRFRVLCDTMGIRDVRSVATAAVRDAANGWQFLDRAERAIGCKIGCSAASRKPGCRRLAS